MSWELLIGIALGGVAAFTGFHLGGVDDRKKKKDDLKKKVDELCSETVECGPFLFERIISVKSEQVIATCVKCPLSSCWKVGPKMASWLPLCGCEAWSKEHFHIRCKACGTKMLVRSKDDVDRPAEPFVVKPQKDPNACKCGSSDATSAELSSGVPAWKCRNCGELRPKLVGGVTPIETN
jgi:hypothetical protein